MISFQTDIKEVLSLFSEALKFMDKNTVQYMVDEMQKNIDKLAAEKDTGIAEKQSLEQENKRLLELLKQYQKSSYL